MDSAVVIVQSHSSASWCVQKKPLLVLIVESRGFFGSANNASCLDNAFVSLHLRIPPRVLHFSALVYISNLCLVLPLFTKTPCVTSIVSLSAPAVLTLCSLSFTLANPRDCSFILSVDHQGSSLTPGLQTSVHCQYHDIYCHQTHYHHYQHPILDLQE